MVFVRELERRADPPKGVLAEGLVASDLVPEDLAGGQASGGVDQAIPEALQREDESRGELEAEGDLARVDVGVHAVGRGGDPGHHQCDEEEGGDFGVRPVCIVGLACSPRRRGYRHRVWILRGRFGEADGCWHFKILSVDTVTRAREAAFEIRLLGHWVGARNRNGVRALSSGGFRDMTAWSHLEGASLCIPIHRFGDEGNLGRLAGQEWAGREGIVRG